MKGFKAIKTGILCLIVFYSAIVKADTHFHPEMKNNDYNLSKLPESDIAQNQITINRVNQFKDKLNGKWVSSCKNHGNGIYSIQKWKFKSNNLFVIDATIYSDINCLSSVSNNKTGGNYKVGNPVSRYQEAQIYEIDMNINDQTKQDIVTLKGDRLIFGLDESSNVRPVRIDEENYLDRVKESI